MEKKLKALMKSIGYYIIKSHTRYDGENHSYETKPYGNVYINTGNIASFDYYVCGDRGKLIAYNKNPLGLIMMFKGERKVFCYVVLKNNFYIGGHNYKVARLTYEKFFDLLNEKDTKIIDKETYDKIKLKMVVEKI